MRQHLFEPVRPDAHGPAPAHRADARFAVKPRSRAGFSLLELVVVIAVASVVAGLGILRYGNSLARYRVDSACRRVISELARAQVEARTTGESRTIRFSTTKNGMLLLTASDIANGRTGTWIILADDPYRVGMDVSGLAAGSVTFDRFGEADGGGIITMRSGGATGAVTIDPSSGRAYVLGSE